MRSDEAVWRGMDGVFDASVRGVTDSVSGDLTAGSESESTRLEIWTSSVLFVLESNPFSGGAVLQAVICFLMIIYMGRRTANISMFSYGSALLGA
jgi:hypothetical protein